MPTVRIDIGPARADCAAVHRALDVFHPAIGRAIHMRPEVVRLAVIRITGQPGANPVHIENLPTPERTAEIIGGVLDGLRRAVCAASCTPVRSWDWPAHGVTLARLEAAAGAIT